MKSPISDQMNGGDIRVKRKKTSRSPLSKKYRQTSVIMVAIILNWTARNWKSGNGEVSKRNIYAQERSRRKIKRVW